MDRVINRRDLAFQLYEVLDVEALCAHKRFAEHGRDTFEAVIDTAEKIALEKFASHAETLDRNEPTFDGERVHIIPEVRTALDAFIDAGFMAAHRDEADGGMALPWTIYQACSALFNGANASTAAYPFLTMGAANLLEAHASQEQKGLYLTPMLDGRFFGTMCLSEPQAGSSLADIRTKAEPADDGSYRLTGNKMWISGGEHELSENIVHMVLAKIPGGPPGVKGISLFIVPRVLVNADGSLGERNDVKLAGLNHKMGYRGTTNCLLNFGEDGRCVGYLVGQPHQGLAYMFHMMNEARIGVGLGATMTGYAGYLYSLDYARDRPQGRAPDARDPATPMVPIIEHADVRRMLLAQKVYVEGALCLCLYAAVLLDEQHASEDAERRAELGALLDILTPIVKAWPSEFCLEANKLAIQVLGGYGYTRDYPVERLYRDNRLNPIHEGTNGIQGLDLLGRKVVMKEGAALKLLLAEIGRTVAEGARGKSTGALATALSEAVSLVTRTTLTLTAAASAGDVKRFLANTNAYLEMLGHTVIAWMWLKQAIAADRGLEAPSEPDRAFYQGKLAAARFFYAHELPKIEAQAKLLAALDTTVLEMPDAGF